MSIKIKLYSIGLVTLVALGILFGIEMYGKAVIHKAMIGEEAIIEAEISMLEARRSEKDFLSRKDVKYVAQTAKCVKAGTRHLKIGAENLDSRMFGEKIKQGVVLLDRYLQGFNAVVKASQIMGLTAKEGLEGELRSAVHQAEDVMKSCNDDSLIAAMLTLRRYEKDFLLRKDQESLNKFNAAMKIMQSKVALAPTLSPSLRASITQRFSVYHKKMNAYVEQYATLENGRKDFTDTIHKMEPLLEELVAKAEIQREKKETFMKQLITGVGIVTAILLVLGIFASVRSILGHINSIKDGTRRVAAGEYDACDALRFSGELEELRLDVVDMASEIKKKIGFSEGTMKAITMPFVVVDTDDKILQVNQSLLDVLEYDGKPEALTGMFLADFVYGDKDRKTITFRAVTERKALRNIEGTLPTQKGGSVDVLIDTSPIYDLDGEILAGFGIFNDLTEIKAQQRKIEEQNERIAATAKQAFEVADQMAGASEELSAQVEQSSRGTEVQRERVTETATAMEEMNATVLEVAKNASGAAEGSDTAKTKAQNGQKIVENVIQAITQVQEQTQILKTNMETLGRQAEDIGNVMNVISDIADQTNLLALNAAIEAARAGEAGRGFAVVADEVRKLAEKTMGATKEVGSAITSIQQGTQGAAADMDKAVKSVEDATELAGRS